MSGWLSIRPVQGLAGARPAVSLAGRLFANRKELCFKIYGLKHASPALYPCPLEAAFVQTEATAAPGCVLGCCAVL